MSTEKIDELKRENAKLMVFYRKVASLTLHHDVIHDRACVSARNLGDALSQVDSDWCAKVPKLPPKK